MFLKLRKGKDWICIPAALCLALGILFYRNSVTPNPSAETELTTPAFTFYPYESEGLTSEELTSPDEEENLLGTVSVSASGARTGKALRYLSAALSACGLLLSVSFILFTAPQSPFLGPEAGLLLLLPIQRLLFFSFYGSFWLHLAYFFFILLSGLLCIRELWCWGFRKHFSLSWSLLYRIALYLSEKMAHPERCLLTLTVWEIAAVSGSLLVWQKTGQILPGCMLISAALPGFFALVRWGRSLGHLLLQVHSLACGEQVTVLPGTFEKTEQELLALQSSHREAVHAAVTNERFKVELISNVSHDLRTPLTSILGYGELLQQESLSPEGQKQLALLNQKAGYMNELVESLFELTKVSSGVLPCKKETIDLIRLLEQTIGLFDDQLTAAGLTVRRHYCGQSLPVFTDGARMHQVFANLLGNAIKYALAGTRIYVEVRCDDQQYVIRMVNTSCYEMDFDPEDIIQRFARGDKARTTKGSGLGLAIAQTYTESTGGRFQVSIDGDQFSAIIMLPLQESLRKTTEI